jgi:glycosyltransferase involved in cell wall biosynthesis
MRILITNSTLALRGGTEAYAFDLAQGLRRAGHEVAAYSNILGETAHDLRADGIAVTDDLAAAPWRPDVLHCHHNMEAMTALLQFPGTPAVFVAHGWTRWLDAPVRHPRVLRYVAVDAPTRHALVERHRVEPERVTLLPNFVDLERFPPRGPLPPAPRRALVLSHYARADTHVPVVREACARRGLALDVRGYGVGRPVHRPERILGQYDLVFAKGRAALEAVVVGAAVVVCDAFGIGPMVTSGNAPALRTLEGAYWQWYAPLGVDALLREIDRYDPGDVAVLTGWARSVAGTDRAVPELVRLYEAARAELAGRGTDVVAETRAAAAYLRWLSRHVKEQLVERDPLAGLAVRARNRLARWPALATLLVRLSARIRARWPAA